MGAFYTGAEPGSQGSGPPFFFGGGGPPNFIKRGKKRYGRARKQSYLTHQKIKSYFLCLFNTPCSVSHIYMDKVICTSPLFQTSSPACGHHGDIWTNKPAKHGNRVSPLSPHYIMLIRLQQALPLARNNRKPLIFNNIFKV